MVTFYHWSPGSYMSDTWLSLVSVTLNEENKHFFAVGNPGGVLIFKVAFAKFCGKAKSDGNIMLNSCLTIHIYFFFFFNF